MTHEHVTCERALDALVSGTATPAELAHLDACPACQGVTLMTRAIQSESEPVPTSPGQRPQWIAELHARSTRRRRLLIVGAFASVGAAAAMLMIALGGAADRPVSVQTTPTRPASLTLSPPPPRPVASGLLASGYVAANAPITLSARVSGRLEELTVDSGQPVKKGQVVAQVSDTDARAQLELANARLRAAQRQVLTMKKLVDAQAATPIQLEEARGHLEIANAEAKVAAQRVDDAKVRSPIDGTVIEVLVRPGEALTSVNQGVLRIANLTSMIVEVDVNETDMRYVVVGQDCEVSSDAQRGRTFKAAVREIAGQADRARGTVRVTLALEPITDGSLKPGMAVQARLLKP